MVEDRARQRPVPRPRRQHRLEVERLRASRPGERGAPRRGEHVAVAAQLTKRRGVFDQRGVVEGVALQRGLEPGQARHRSEAAAHQLALERQRDRVVGRQRRGAARRGVGQPDLPARKAQAAEIGPGARVVRRGPERRLQHRRRLAPATEGGERAGADADGVRGVVRALDQRERAVGIALQHAGVRDEAAQSRRRRAEPARAGERRLGRPALLHPEIGAREQQLRLDRARVARDRRLRVGAGGIVVAGRERRPARGQCRARVDRLGPGRGVDAGHHAGKGEKGDRDRLGAAAGTGQPERPPLARAEQRIGCVRHGGRSSSGGRRASAG